MIVKKIDSKIKKLLEDGKVGVLATDTIYGLVGSALKIKTVERIYKIKKRNPKKPYIILISSIKDLAKFSVKPKRAEKEILNKYWPGRISFILTCSSKKFSYLHRGTRSLAFRLPRKKSLITLIKQTGPLVAPSANPEGLPPAKNIKEAKKYFGNKIDFYVDSGLVKGKSSTLAEIRNGKLRVLRKGAVGIK